jgi:hypothetical protein
MKPFGPLNFIVVLVLGVLVFVFDEKVATDLYHQHEALSFPTTTGRVYHSAVTITHGSKGGISYHINILYDYQVGGQSFQGSRFRYGLFPPGSVPAYAAIRAHPVGSEVTVYYRTDDPSDSLLSPGVVGRDFLIFFILMPASLLVLYVLCASNTPPWLKPNTPLAGGVQIISQGSQIRARLPRYPVLAWSLAVFSGTSVVSLGALSIATTRDPSPQPEAIAGILILAATAVVFWWRRARLLSGVDDLVIDEGARTVSLPQTFGRNRASCLEFSAVRAVYLETIAHRSKGGYYYSWASTLELQNNASPERLTDWYDEEKSLAFAGWLRERLHLSGTANQPVAVSSAFSLSRSVG